MDEAAVRMDKAAVRMDEVAVRTDEVAAWMDEVATRTDEIAAWMDKVAARRGRGRMERLMNREKLSVLSTRKDKSETHQPGSCSRSHCIPIPTIHITARAHRL